jgi:hypothetical protein
VSVLAAMTSVRVDETFVPVRGSLILASMILLLIGVTHRLRDFDEGFRRRATTAAYLAMACITVLPVYLATDEEWDTLRLVLCVFVGAVLAGALLVLLPLRSRRIGIVFLVLFHFGGILTAVFSYPLPNGEQCWVAGVSWTYIYRPYLQFMHLNNSYHFFAPEPGPAKQLWFRIAYEGDKAPARWVRLPEPGSSSTRLLHDRYRRMAANAAIPRRGLPDDFFAPKGRLWRRTEERSRIPYHSDLQANKESREPDPSQYCEPLDLCKKYIASYARHVAHDVRFRSPDCPDIPVRTVKVYLVLQCILTPWEMAQGMDPKEPTKFLPAYMGEFDAEGSLIDADDPLLYWVVPIIRQRAPDGDDVVKDYVAVHAGDTPLADRH